MNLKKALKYVRQLLMAEVIYPWDELEPDPETKIEFDWRKF